MSALTTQQGWRGRANNSASVVEEAGLQDSSRRQAYARGLRHRVCFAMGRGKLYAVCTAIGSKCTIRHCLLTRFRVSVSGTEAAEWDKNTWGPLEDLATNHPEAGVHFQGMWDYTRSNNWK